MRIFAFLILLVFTVPAFAAEDIYICPMHPHIHGEEGDTCPICGMDLVLQNEPAAMSMPENDMEDMVSENAIHIDPTFLQALGVKTGIVSSHTFGRNIRSFGEVVPSTRNETMFHMRTEGWVVDLATDAVGDTVKKGDLLFTYYSPDLMNAQSDFLIGNRVGNAEERLELYGMDNEAITKLKEKGRMMRETPFYAPADGTVVTLNVRKGSFVKEGELALSLQDFSHVWVNADVPVRDLQFLAEGQKAKAIVPETEKVYESSIDFIHHTADPQTRTGIVRLVVPHAHLEPKPGTYVDVVFDADSKKRLAVPVEAVLYGAQGATVIEHLGNGKFRPVAVETGITAEGFTEITSGLQIGQKIVTSGQFMIDAESNLRGGMASMGMDMEGMEMNDGTDSMNMEGGHVH